MVSPSRVTRMSFSPDGKTSDYFWIAGSKANSPILLVPGFTGTHSDLLQLTEILKEHFFVIIPDLPGWGLSPQTSRTLTIHNYAVYLKKLLKELDIGKVTICGHCKGATVAIETAYLFPHIVKQIIIVSTPYIGGTLS